MGAGDTHTVEVHGDNGDCTGIPADAVAVSMNVTAVDATADTFLTIWAADAPRPTASSLNPAPGAPPTPNAVTTNVNGDGEFSIFNLAGNVHVLADVNGYYVDHQHDDRYYTKAESDARYPLPFAVGVEISDLTSMSATFTTLLSVEVVAPADGHVTVQSSANARHATAGADVICNILRSTDPDPGAVVNATGNQWFESAGSPADDGHLAGSRLFDVVAGSTTTFQLRCREVGDGGSVSAPSLIATYTPAP